MILFYHIFCRKRKYFIRNASNRLFIQILLTRTSSSVIKEIKILFAVKRQMHIIRDFFFFSKYANFVLIFLSYEFDS